MSKITVKGIGPRVLTIRGQKVMLDRDLAELYEVPTKRLNEQVKRNISRFPSDFMFQLNAEEAESLRSQFATSNRGGRRYLPLVFTEHGVAMLSTVLNSERAIQINIAIIRTFVMMREMMSTHKEIARRLDEVERKVGCHDKEVKAIFDVIRKMIAEPPPEPGKKKPRIGFK